MKSERMLMMNLAGDINDMDSILSDIVSEGTVQIVDANNLISNSNFLFPINDENINIAMDINYINKYKSNIKQKEEENKLDEINKYLKLDLKKDKNIRDISTDKENLKDIYERLNIYVDSLKDIDKKINEKEKLIKNFNVFKSLDMDIKELFNMKNFKYRFGILSKNDRLKIKKNYENIFAAIFHLDTTDEGEVYLIIYPSDVEVDISRTLKSLNFEEIFMPDNFTGRPIEIVKNINEEILKLENEKNILLKYIEEYKENYEEELADLLKYEYNILSLENIKPNIAVSENYFFLSSWIGESDIEKLKKELESNYNLTIQFQKTDAIGGVKPPTKLKNNLFLKPFELLVKMYGTPNYNEMDPTPFFAITYMILFGSMFGDVGQGLVFILGGILISKFMNESFGGLLTRLGLSSVIFGFLYGSFFGFEELLPAIFIRPYENINTMLIIAIGFGVILLLLSYCIGIYNAWKEKDIEELFFSEKGVAGFLLYLLLLSLAINILVKVQIIPKSINILLIIISIFMMVFKKPLANKISGKKDLYDGESVSGYYIEGSFSVIETLISIFSGTISFIRVGAFAINHVGLFLAFSTIGKMTNSFAGNIIMLIVGNIIIIGLEGLIVFIQSLRLEYYEMFSKFYKGDGVEFVANTNKF